MRDCQRLSIGGLLHVLIDSSSPWRADLVGAFGDAPDLESATIPETGNDAHSPVRVEIYHAAVLPTERLRQLQRGLYVGDGFLVDRRYGVEVSALDEGGVRLRANAPCVEWLSWALELALLRARATFVHGAGVEIGGQAVLLPSWGGVGKTAIAKRFVSELGWRLLGDDMVILTKCGECRGYPKPMVLYPYHRDIFPTVFASGRGPVAPSLLNHALSRLAVAIKPWLRLAPGVLQWARRHNPQSVRIRPSHVFGAAGLASVAQLNAVVWLDRAPGLSTPLLHEVSPEDVASRMFGSTLREQDAWCVNATLVACGLGMVRARDVFSAWADLLDQAVQSASHWVLLIPQETSIQHVGHVVENALRAALPELF